jgi:hypothetical protein
MHHSKISGAPNQIEKGTRGMSTNRDMLRFLQRRKFRLVTKWKARLKQNITFQLPTGPEFPYRLVFRAFDEVLRLLKSEMCDVREDFSESLLADQSGGEVPTADQFMEMFLTGRDVFGEFVTSDKTFCASFPGLPRAELGAGIERAMKNLVDREMNEFARLRQTDFRRENQNPA